MASTTKQMNITAGNAQATVNATVNDSMPAIPCPDPAGYRYVGARYVPLFADPLQWSSANTYEPLTIVVNEGNSYTSRTFVPVGIDIENEDYWALTGNYNAQVEQYRQEVQGFNGRITAIENSDKSQNVLIDNLMQKKLRSIGFIGDSWCDPATTVYNWPQDVATAKGATLYNVAESGAGFLGNTAIADTFDQQLTTLHSQVTELDLVVLIGGANDLGRWASQRDEISTGINNFISKYKQFYPDTPFVYMGVNAMAHDMNTVNQYSDLVIFRLVNQGVNVTFCDITDMIFRLQAYKSPTDLHPAQNGDMYLSEALLTFLNGGIYTSNSITPQITTTTTNTVVLNGKVTLGKFTIEYPAFSISTSEETIPAENIRQIMSLNTPIYGGITPIETFTQYNEYGHVDYSRNGAVFTADKEVPANTSLSFPELTFMCW